MNALSSTRVSPHKPSMRPVPKQAAATGPAIAAPTLLGSSVLLVALAVVGMNLHGNTPQEIAAFAARYVAVGIVLSVLSDLRFGLKNLIRPDLMAIVALYFLTLFEFLVKQNQFDLLIENRSVKLGVIACLWGMAGLVIGRHLTLSSQSGFINMFDRPVKEGVMITLFWVCLVIGFFHMLLAVNFNVATMFSYFVEPRFTQPWTRGQFGDWKALLNELGLLLYLIPPLGGIILAKRNVYPKTQVILVCIGMSVVFFYGFSSGTRNIFACYLVTFLIGYSFSLPDQKRKELLIVAGITSALLLISTSVMLQFRQIGLRNYWLGNYDSTENSEEALFIDNNLYVISRLVEIFPRPHHYLGMEIPYLAIIRPIPRAMWPGKPQGLSISMEDALGVEDLTLASSFIGEAYISDGLFGVFMTGLFFGALAGWWGRLASPRNSDYGILVYASGFFAMVISMRSLFVFTTALLPTLAAMIFGWIMAEQVLTRRARFKPELSTAKQS